MTARTNAFAHVLFKSGINNELMIATFDKCNIQDDDVSYTCGGKVIYGELLTVVTNPVSTPLPSSNITRQHSEMTNSNEITSAIETVENFGSSPSHRSTIEFVTSTELNVQVYNRSNETPID
ncbi:unnamed protein product [Rotaria socialis]|uniref:Uncharacterized protein n=1 Tax=Rotaria socialis TaxID=392032 RepID=A0A818QRC1_9BILA|nr:unnamed protein product [Rotaria socialis]